MKTIFTLERYKTLNRLKNMSHSKHMQTFILCQSEVTQKACVDVDNTLQQ